MAETIVLGRKAHNETFASGRLTDYWQIDRAGAALCGETGCWSKAAVIAYLRQPGSAARGRSQQ